MADLGSLARVLGLQSARPPGLSRPPPPPWPCQEARGQPQVIWSWPRLQPGARQASETCLNFLLRVLVLPL